MSTVIFTKNINQRQPLSPLSGTFVQCSAERKICGFSGLSGLHGLVPNYGYFVLNHPKHPTVLLKYTERTIPTVHW